MRLRSPESRIVSAFLVLLLDVQVAAFLIIQEEIAGDARASIREELEIGERVFNYLLDRHLHRPADDMRVLANDPALGGSANEHIARELHQLTGLHVSFMTSETAGAWLPGASTLPDGETLALAAQLRGQPGRARYLPDLRLEEHRFSAQLVDLGHGADQSFIAVLLRPAGETMRSYDHLRLALFGFMLLGIATTVLGGMAIARRFTEPLRRLNDAARRLDASDYDGHIASGRDDVIGDLSRTLESMRDGISRRELAIRRLAYWDALTDLPNRAQFTATLTAAIARAAQSGMPCHLLIVDLDRFKSVNDVLGRRIGDALLRQVAQRLQIQAGGRGAHIARLGGDQFAILLPCAGIDEARAVAARILRSMERPVLLLDEHKIDLDVGIGIAGHPTHGDEAETLLAHAEAALYAAKESRMPAVVYDPAIEKDSQRNLMLLGELRRAVKRGELRLYVQPKVLLPAGRVIGVEALVRWAHPDKGLVLPDQFIPFAEKSGFIRAITRWMLEQSAALAAGLAAHGLELRISVNISPRDLLDQELPARFAAILARHRIAPSSFCLELTESAIMDDAARAQQTIEALHAMEIHLSIDDFGTGYSSLAYLKRLPVDELKIDKSFVMNMERDAGDAMIVRSTIDLGHTLGLNVVAEGLETEAAWRLLAGMGCDQAQGYFISRPMPAEQLADWLQNWAPPGFSQAPTAQSGATTD